MTDTLLSFTSLPNMHPAVVHFPLALLPIAIVLDLACVLSLRSSWLDRAAAAAYALGALGAGAAYLAGKAAEDSLGQVRPPVALLVADHADWARMTLWTFAGVAVARLVLVWRSRRDFPRRRRVLQAALFGASACGAWFLFQTADRGGALVYRHGVAVAWPGESGSVGADRGTTAPRRSPVQEQPPGGSRGKPGVEARLVRGADGSLVWRPLPGDGTALGTILRPLEGGSTTSTVGPERQSGGDGLALHVSGTTFLVLSGLYDDLQMEARLEVSDFQGTVGLAHGVGGQGDASVFQVSTRGHAALVRVSGGSSRFLDSGSVRPPGGAVHLAASAAGSHFKGLVDGEVVVHGHAPRSGPGQVGLFLDGSGIVRIVEVRVTPLSQQ